MQVQNGGTPSCIYVIVAYNIKFNSCELCIFTTLNFREFVPCGQTFITYVEVTDYNFIAFKKSMCSVKIHLQNI